MANKKELPKKMDLKSMDVGADNRTKLRQLFPSVFSETKTKDGELVDRSFQGNDQLKANAVQTFAALNQNRDKIEQIIFRTV